MGAGSSFPRTWSPERPALNSMLASSPLSIFTVTAVRTSF